MKILTITVALCLLFAYECAFATSSPAPAAQDDGFALAEQTLLQEVVPAKEEKKAPADESLIDLPAPKEEPEDAGAIDSADRLADALSNTSPKKDPGSLDYEMDTVGTLADAPGGPVEASVAKR